MEIIDSHAHLGYDSLYDHIDEIMERCQQAGVTTIINICTDRKTAERGQTLAKTYPHIHNVGATTPHDVLKEGANDFPFFAKLAKEKKLVAIGETGLDYHYEHSPKKLQQEFLCRYFALAKECNLPVVIHCRDAFEDLFTIADENYLHQPLLLHCFTGTRKEAEQALDRGWKISMSGIVTFKKSTLLQEAAQFIPLESMLVETDSPYLAPQSKRGLSNEPSFVVEVVEMIARLKNISSAQVAAQTLMNTLTFFKLSK